MADPARYLRDFTLAALRAWPDNRTLTIVCHGHSVPAGYSATPIVDTFAAYPHLWHGRLKGRFPSAVLNVVVTAIGGENAEGGAARFVSDVLPLRPDVVTIDYGLNDRGLGLERAGAAWQRMIAAARDAGAKVILLTPTWEKWDNMDDLTGLWAAQMGTSLEAARAMLEAQPALSAHAELIRELATAEDVGLADAYAAFERYVAAGGDVGTLLSWPNHPNRRGHELIADELMRWIPFALPAPVA